MENLEKVLKICKQIHVSLSTIKFHMMREGVILGHFLSVAGIKVDPTKVEVILHFPVPKKPTQVCRFIGCGGYYRRFIENISTIAHPLFQLVTKDVEFLSTEYCETAFTKIKGLVCMAPIL